MFEDRCNVQATQVVGFRYEPFPAVLESNGKKQSHYMAIDGERTYYHTMFEAFVD